MESKATLKYARVSPRKARSIARLVAGQAVADAVTALRFSDKRSSELVLKLLDSAIANAKDQDSSIDLDNLYVHRAWVDKAPNRFMRRWRPRAMGRATRITKGVSHITLVLSSEAPAGKKLPRNRRSAGRQQSTGDATPSGSQQGQHDAKEQPAGRTKQAVSSGVSSKRGGMKTATPEKGSSRQAASTKGSATPRRNVESKQDVSAGQEQPRTSETDESK